MTRTNPPLPLSFPRPLTFAISALCYSSLLAVFLLPVHAQTLTVLHSFATPSALNGTNVDGANPITGLALVGNSLCGSAVNGGRFAAGSMFALNPDGTGFLLIRSFTNSADAQNPESDFVPRGNAFYGTSFGGGPQWSGTIFASQTNGSGSVLRSFLFLNSDTATNVGGGCPAGPLVLSGTALYGAATTGGFYANGSLFVAATNGSTLSSLHDFSLLDSISGTNTDGATPWGGLILSGNTLYGTASAGGTAGNGTVFSINTSGTGFTTLYSFSSLDPVTRTNADGAIPYGGLVLSNGILYGTTMVGGTGANGTVFSVSTNGSNFAVLHHFSALNIATGTNVDGAKPCSDLTLSGTTLYGTTPAGGNGAVGSLFSLKTDGSSFNSLYSFSPINAANGTNTDGAWPIGGLLLLSNSVYGTAFGGGPGAAGTVFSLSVPAPPATIMSIVPNPNGTFTLSFIGGPNSTNIVQACSDLPSRLWQNISTNIADGGGNWQFTDPNATQTSVRFYRSYAP
jgi:uncharacterized repeat protein (TIGR03803 family)